MARRTLRQTWLCIAVAATAGAGPASQPATQPAPQLAGLPTTQPAGLLSQVDAAYAALASAEFDGHIKAHFDVGGQVQDHDAAFTSAFAGPNKFRHEVPGDTIACSTGTHVYAGLTKPGEYLTGDAPKGRAAAAEWPAGVGPLLANQNPSLLLAIVPSAKAELADGARPAVDLPPTLIDGVSCPTVRLDATDGGQTDTLSFDPTSHLLRRDVTDLRGTLAKRGTADVRAATVTVDYTTVHAGATAGADRFAYAPPASAVLATAGPVAQGDDGPPDADDPATAVSAALVGHVAPVFKLDTLDGKPVAVADLKGKVVVLDMWATWCGPCVASLPGVDEMARAYQAAGAAVAVYAIDQTTLEASGPDPVRAFVKRKGWTLPVLLDVDGVVNKAYMAEAIPETVIVGKDGLVKKVFVGGGQEEAIKAVVDRELTH